MPSARAYYASSKCILKVVNPFYSISEAGNYWFAKYHNHFINIYAISESNYDSSLFHRYELFGIVKLQTNDILMLVNNIFGEKYESNGATYPDIEAGKVVNYNYFFPQAPANFLLSLNVKF